MSYFARLREQSRGALTAARVTSGAASRAVDALARDAHRTDHVDSAADTLDLERVEVLERSTPGQMARPDDIPRDSHPTSAAAPPARPVETAGPASTSVRSVASPVEAPTQPSRPQPQSADSSRRSATDVAAPQRDEHASATSVDPRTHATLHQVFEWIAAAEPAEHSHQPASPIAPRGPARAQDSADAIDAVAMAASIQATRMIAPMQPPLHEADVVEAVSIADAGRDRAPSHRPEASRRATRGMWSDDAGSDIEEQLTVSIGAIHVRVEAPAPAPRTAAVARPSPPRESDSPRVAAPRLARHYLRP